MHPLLERAVLSGVMVALQILVLSVWVRVLAKQQWRLTEVSLFFFLQFPIYLLSLHVKIRFATFTTFTTFPNFANLTNIINFPNLTAMYDVFISYSRKDTSVIDRIEQEFKKYGITMFIDRAGIDAGTDWAQTIAQALYDSEVILFVWSENSNTSENTANEIALAIEYQKTIVPFKIGEFKADFKLSYRLIRFNRIDALPYNEGKVVELGQKMAKLLGKQKTEPQPATAAPVTSVEPVVPRDDKRLELKYKTGKDALLGFQLEEAVKDLTEPAIKNYKDARLLLSYIVTKGPRIMHVSKEVFKPFYDAAEQENGYALFVIACVASFLEVDHDAAYGYARLSADLGDDYGMYWVSESYDRGHGIKKDTREGENYRQQAIDKGNVLALLLHARNLQFGWTIKKNPKKGFSILQMLAEKQIPEAVYRLAYCYEIGVGVQKDLKKAEELYHQSVELGYIEGYDSIASLHIFDDKGNITESDEEKKTAYAFLMKGTKLNETACISSLANGYYYGTFVKQDYAQALRWYKKAAQLGDGFAYYMIANMYYYGNGVDENNEEAWSWAKRGAERGVANCIYFKGIICQDGFAPQEQQQSDCIRFYEEAADLGGYGAEQSLLQLYEIYRPDWYNMYQLKKYKEYDWAEKNEEKAVAAIRRAAEYDNTDAQYLYAVILTDTTREDADEFTGVDMLEQVAERQPLAYIRLAMLSLEGIGRPFSQDYALDMCDKAKDADVDETLIDYVLGKTLIQILGDAEPDANNKKDFDDILEQFRPCIDKQMIEAYEPYSDTLFRLVGQNNPAPAPSAAASQVTHTGGAKADASIPDLIFIFKSWGAQPTTTGPSRKPASDSAYADMLFKAATDYAETGLSQALFDLGICYQLGIGTSANNDEAVEAYKRAAELGHSRAALNLGRLYFDQNDKKEAKYWLRKALELGCVSEDINEMLNKC